VAKLVPVIGHDGRATAHYKAVDDHGRTQAVGTIDVDLVPGASRHGGLQFVIQETTEPSLQKDLEQQVRLEP
jgi:hypothetical protein